MISMGSFSEAWDARAREREVEGGDLLAMTFLISLFIVRVIMKLFC